MAEFEGMAKALQIDSKVLGDLEKVDKKIQSIADNSERMAKAFQSAMSSMSGDAGTLLERLTRINSILSGLGSINAGGLNNVSSSMGNVATEGERAASSLANAASAVNNFGASGKNIAELREEINKINEELRKGGGVRPFADQQYLVDYRKQLQDELKAQETSNKERNDAYQKMVEKQSKEDERKYLSWLKLKDQELKEEQRVETEKAKARAKNIQEHLKQLEELRKKQEKWARESAEAAASGDEYKQNRRKVEQMYSQMFDEIERREKASNEKRLREQQRMAEQQAKIDSRLRRSNYQSYVTSTEGSLRTADRANTYTQRAQAVKNLEAAMKNLRTTSANYQRDLARLTDAHKRLTEEQRKFEQGMGRVAKEQSNLMNHSQQLARQLALIFSVSAIEGYVRKLIEVRGEFEKQNVALATLLGNQDQANKLQGQITELAVQSPFSLRELTSYTKSLAAYNVEYEELYDTTKMLADVSSGLGVDMQRLILAFGQVKAANFLRGTETRQFTEAGINMLGELAKYYSELEGRIVSVGEVQERQFKRMISFQDVAEVFKRITSEGGMFYEMQERQAETLAGMYTNLTDSVDVMLNEIGIANEDILKGAVAAVRDVVVNWREVLFVIKPVVTTLGSYIAVATLARIGTSSFADSLSRLAGNATTGAGRLRLLSAAMTTVKNAARGLAVSLAAILPVALIGGLIELVRRLTEASRAATEFRESIIEITNTGTLKASELAANFERLANEAVNAADGSEEQNKALEKLNKTYEDIIPQDEMKIARLREMKGAYDSVTTAIYNKIEADTRDNLLQEVNNTYGKKSVEAFSNLSNALQEFRISANNARTIVAEFRAGLESGEITKDNAIVKLQGLIEQYTGDVVTLQRMSKFYIANPADLIGVEYLPEINEAVDAFGRFKEKSGEVMDFVARPFVAGGGSEMYKNLKKNLDEVSKIGDKWQKENKGKFALSIEFSEEAKREQIDAYQDFIDEINNKIKSGEIKGTDVTSARLAIQEAQEAIDSLNVNDIIRKVNELRLEMSKLTGVDFGKLNFTEMQASDGLAEYRKSVQSMLETYENAVKEFDSFKAKGEQMPWLRQEELLQGISSEEELRKRTDALRQYVNVLFGYNEETNKGRGGSKNPALDALKEQIRLLEEAKKRYDELRKYMSDGEATSKVREIFADTEVGNIVGTMTFDASGMIDGFKKLVNNAGEEGQKELDKRFRHYEAEIFVDVNEESLKEVEKKLDKIFKDYESSRELEKSGVPKGIINNLWGIKTIDINDVKSGVNAYYDQLKGTEGEKLWRKYYERITEIEQEELEERMKKYSDYLKESIDEEKRIRMEAGATISGAQSFFNEGKLDSGQYISVLRNVISDMNNEISSINTQKFKESTTYLQAMGDLASFSTSKLKSMRSEIEDLISKSAGEISPSDMKVYQDALDKINDAIQDMGFPNDNNPFLQLKQLRKLQKDYAAEQKKYNALLNERNQLEGNLSAIQKQIDITKADRDKSVQENGATSPTTIALNNQLSGLMKGAEGVLGQIQGVDSALASSSMSMSSMSSAMDALGGGAGGFAGAMGVVDKIVKGIYQTINGIIEMFNEIRELAETFGQDVDEGKWAQWGIAMEYIGEMNQNVMDSWESFKSGDMMGASINAFKAVSSVVQGFNKLHDNKRENKIKKELELIDDLQYEYQKLEDAIDEAYSIDTFEESTENARENLKEQNEALKRSIALERDKKDQDEERIKEWERQIEENIETIKDIEEDAFNEATNSIIENVLSAADDFTQAWMEAFKETGKGMSGLEDTFDEMLSNMLQRQASLSITSTFLDKWKKQLEKYVNADDMELNANEARDWVESVKDDLPILNSSLQAYFEALKEAGIDISKLGDTDTMSGLQQGIEGLTEQTGEALAALLESVRFFVSDSNTVIHNIYNWLMATPAETPLMQELRLQTQHLASMDSLLTSVIKSSSGKGKVMRVEIV